MEIVIHDPRLHNWGTPRPSTTSSAAIDLRACIDKTVAIAPGSCMLVSAGFAIHITDPNLVGYIFPRSGLGSRGLILGNTIGVIDADYQGVIKISFWNRNPSGGESFTIKPGDRVAQLVIAPITRPNLVIVDKFSTGTDRGHGGFGSTGS